MSILPRRNTRYWLIIIFVFLLFIAGVWGSAIYRMPLERRKIILKDKEILVWTAKTDSQQRRGLQYIIWLPKNSGILFIFQKPDKYCFWNKNTFLTLQVFFLYKGEIIKEDILKPFWYGIQTICADEPVDSVIEIPINNF